LKLYKYKSLQNFEHFADIILNKRFYAAKFFELNDPMEGFFHYEQGTKDEYLNKIIEGKEKVLICSFSKEPDNILLWSHYADGCRGACIEVEADTNDGYPMTDVYYTKRTVTFPKNRIHNLTKVIPPLLLIMKNVKWKYEKEVRMLSNNKYIYGPKITSVLLGNRISDIAKKIILKIVPFDIPIYETDIQNNKIKKGKQINLKYHRRRFNSVYTKSH
jgi:hypothetical protein